MATSPAPVVSTTSIDASGISTATGDPSSSDPRLGAIYNPALLAAAQPIWFHPLKDGRHLMVMSRQWSAATPVGGTPGVYSAYTESTAPSWSMISGASGALASVPGGSSIPLKTVVDSGSAVVVAGASRPPQLMWLLHAATVTTDDVAILQHFDVALNGAITNGGEEVLPSTATVVFNKGLQYATPFLYAYGTDDTGAVYRIRKAWNRIGFNKTNPMTAPYPGMVWEYYTGTGWSKDITELAPVSGLNTAGPLSFGYYRSLVVAAGVGHSGSLYTGKFWTSTAGRPWTQVPGSVVLGTDDTYLGGTVQLQSQLGAAPAALADGANAGIPYVSSVKVSTEGEDSLSNSWGVWSVNLVG